MVKAGTVLIVGGLGVLGLVAYLVYRTVKNTEETFANAPQGVANAIGSGYDAINRDFGAAGQWLATGAGNIGGYIGGLFNRTQAPSYPHYTIRSLEEQQASVHQAYVALGGESGAIRAQTDEAQQISRAARGGFGGL